MKSKHITYLKMSEIFAKDNSKANRKKVGCLIVKKRQTISDGVNGTLPGFDNTCEDEQGNTKPEVVHAEFNALMKLAKSTSSSVGSTMYITLSPCYICAQMIISAGIRRVFFKEVYRDQKGIELLKQANIKVKQINF